MKILFVLTFLANVALTLVSLTILPPHVATHFGAGGMADGWAPNHVNTLIMTGLDVLLFVSLYFTPQLISIFPARWVNLPHKDYWLTPEHMDEAQAKIGAYIWQFGAVIFVFMFVLGCLSIHANLSDPVQIHEPTIFASLSVLLVYTVVWTVAIYRTFRAPVQGGTPRSTIKEHGL